MNRNELKIGEYYFNDTGMSDVVFIFDSIFHKKSVEAKYYIQIIRNLGNCYFNNNVIISCDNVRLATPEEKHWLNECISANRFISKEEAMKSFVSTKTVTTTIDKFNYSGEIETPKGTSFEVNRELKNSYEVKYKDGFLYLHKCYFEPEFILPEKWALKSPSRGVDNIINKYARTIKGDGKHWSNKNNYAKDFWLHINNGIYNCGNITIKRDYTEITFEQFKKYVLKEDIQPETFRKVTVELESKVYSLEEITKVLTKEYDKVDVEDILKVIKTIR